MEHKEIKLNIGCGNEYMKGYINCDWTDKVKVDKIVDLEKPLEMFESNSVKEIICNHVLEHINNFIPLMHELNRICKANAIIKIKLPFYAGWGQFNDPTHVRFFTPFTFDYFKKGNYSHETECEEDMFQKEYVHLNFGAGSSSKLNWIFNPLLNLNHRVYCRFFAWICPASEIEFRLKVLKSN